MSARGWPAPPAGWQQDRDDWYTRPRRPGDPDITDSAVGFTTAARVYVRTADYARAYDAGDPNGGSS